MSSEELWYCPFCNKQTIKVWRIPAHAQSRYNRGSGQTRNINFRAPGSVTILSGCPSCGKTLEEVKKKLV